MSDSGLPPLVQQAGMLDYVTETLERRGLDLRRDGTGLILIQTISGGTEHHRYRYRLTLTPEPVTLLPIRRRWHRLTTALPGRCLRCQCPLWEAEIPVGLCGAHQQIHPDPQPHDMLCGICGGVLLRDVATGDIQCVLCHALTRARPAPVLLPAWLTWPQDHIPADEAGDTDTDSHAECPDCGRPYGDRTDQNAHEQLHAILEPLRGTIPDVV